MADENLRRALMVGQGSLKGFVERPVSLILIAATVLLVVAQLPQARRLAGRALSRRRAPSDAGDRP